ncbi:hypothetical protein AB1Y20_001677 [Prymnesium parvum]|uniref:F5/8 type C domain-containing protein n=1 Tax=Prymnesium parvum TaxID=97485 RepID=A0AB34K901_PRYPA
MHTRRTPEVHTPSAGEGHTSSADEGHTPSANEDHTPSADKGHACADGFHDVAVREKSIQVSASSHESAERAAVLAIDGDDSTRWASEFGDVQWIQVDFDQPYLISTVAILWEAALPKQFDVELCVSEEQAICGIDENSNRKRSNRRQAQEGEGYGDWGEEEGEDDEDDEDWEDEPEMDATDWTSDEHRQHEKENNGQTNNAVQDSHEKGVSDDMAAGDGLGALLSPSTNQTAAPSQPPTPCRPCTDVPDSYMREHSLLCPTFSWAHSNRCNSDALWRKYRICSLSCFLAGNGYPTDNNCCLPSPPPPSPPPSPPSPWITVAHEDAPQHADWTWTNVAWPTGATVSGVVQHAGDFPVGRSLRIKMAGRQTPWGISLFTLRVCAQNLPSPSPLPPNPPSAPPPPLPPPHPPYHGPLSPPGPPPDVPPPPTNQPPWWMPLPSPPYRFRSP